MKDENKFQKIISVNDFHSNLPDGVEFLEKLFEYKRSGNLLIDVGDFSEGSAFYDFSKGKLERNSMEILFDVIVPGNHGFEDVLQMNSNKVVNCNVVDKNGRCIFKPFDILQVNQKKILVIGVISEDAFLSIPISQRESYEVQDPATAIRKQLDEYEAQVDFVILCSHCGTEYDKSNFTKFEEIDLILSSHCHTPGNIFDKDSTQIRKADELGGSLLEISILDNHLNIEVVKVVNSQTEFSVPELKEFNRYLERFQTDYDRVLYSITTKDIVLINDRISLVNRLLTFIGHENRNYFLNYTFFRSTNLKNTLKLSDIANIIPFDTKIFVIKDEFKNIEKFIANIPIDIKEMSISSLTKTENVTDQIEIITTNYLFDNFFPKGNEKITNEINVRDIFINLITHI